MFITIKHIFMETCFCHGIQIFKLHVTLVHNSDFSSQNCNIKINSEKKIQLLDVNLQLWEKVILFFSPLQKQTIARTRTACINV